MIDEILLIRIIDWCQKNFKNVEELTQEDLEEAKKHRPNFPLRKKN